jgi:hypothetical protein
MGLNSSSVLGSHVVIGDWQIVRDLNDCAIVKLKRLQDVWAIYKFLQFLKFSFRVCKWVYK